MSDRATKTGWWGVRRGVRSRRGFTLMEILVAVGAVALISVGLAAILDSVGRTVTGGRRVSTFNTFATQLEIQLRKDFEAMTREGFLVIRQQYANVSGTTPGNIPKTADDPTPRPRRVDEIVFFARGDFTSAREPLHPDLAPRGKHARIYYGMGTRRRPDTASGPANTYLTPELTDRNDLAGMGLGEPQPGNPNRYALSWTLLRHAATLAPPDHSDRSYPPSIFGINTASTDGQRIVRDKEAQVGLQPAASSVFRRLAELRPHPDSAYPLDASNYIRVTPSPPWSSGALSPTPNLASGLVDVIATDLATVRMELHSMQQFPQQTGLGAVLQPLTGDFTPGPQARARIQAWMAEAFPAPSEPTPQRPVGVRMRYEAEPTNYVGTLVLPEGTDAQRLEKAYRLADQRMLTVSNFVPRCVEFIVEWSFGEIDAEPTSPTFGQLVFYGGRLNPSSPTDYRIRQYPNPTATQWANPPTITLRNGQVVPRLPARELIYGSPAPAANATFLTNYFGYVDPAFNPDLNGNGQADPTDSADPWSAWPWPALVRVTVTMADALDPTIEQSFQFILPVPER
jgi:prepilin-type N-terminal cleavage/methylation domain-containing protein